MYLKSQLRKNIKIESIYMHVSYESMLPFPNAEVELSRDSLNNNKIITTVRSIVPYRRHEADRS